MSNVKRLYTRRKSNEGVRVPIPGTEDWLLVYGTDSDHFAAARAERARESALILSLPEDQRPDAIRKADLRLVASMVAGWSFEDEFTPEAVLELLEEAPYIFKLVNEASTDRSLFLPGS